MPDCTEIRGGQTALQGGNYGLSAVSHIQAHQYYADVLLNSGLLDGQVVGRFPGCSHRGIPTPPVMPGPPQGH
jgi:hypothetical protein